MADNPRIDAARDHDDRELINNITADAATGLSPSASAGFIADLETQAELNEVTEPDGTTRPTKQDDIDHGQAYAADRRGDRG